MTCYKSKKEKSQLRFKIGIATILQPLKSMHLCKEWNYKSTKKYCFLKTLGVALCISNLQDNNFVKPEKLAQGHSLWI